MYIYIYICIHIIYRSFSLSLSFFQFLFIYIYIYIYIYILMSLSVPNEKECIIVAIIHNIYNSTKSKFCFKNNKISQMHRLRTQHFLFCCGGSWCWGQGLARTIAIVGRIVITRRKRLCVSGGVVPWSIFFDIKALYSYIGVYIK